MSLWWPRLGVLLGLALLTVGPASAAAAPSGAAVADAQVAFAYGALAFHEGRDEDALRLLREAVALSPNDGTARHWLGLTYLRLGRAREAVRELEASLAARVAPEAGRLEVLADLGAAQLEAGDAAGAAKTLREVVNRRPQDVGSLYRYGVALVRSGREGQGEEAIREAKRLRPGVDTEEVVIAPGLGGEVVVVQAPPHWEARLGVAAASDSNPNLLSQDLVVLTPEGELIEGPESDGVVHVDLRLAHQTYLAGGARTLGFVVQGKQSLHSDFDFLDLGEGGGVLQVAWGKDPLGYVTGPLGYLRVPFGESRVAVLLQVGMTVDLLDGDSYLRTRQAALTLVVREGGRTATQIELDFQDQDFFRQLEGDLERSGELLSVDLSQFFFFGRRHRYLRLGLTGRDRTAGRAFEGSIFEGRAELSLPLARSTTLHLVGAWRQDEFDHPESNLFDPVSGPPREDTTLRATAALVVKLRRGLFLTARGSYTDREADLGALPEFLPSLDYDRTVAALGLNIFF